MGTICQLYVIHPNQIQYSGRKATKFAITKSMNLLQLESSLLDTYPVVKNGQKRKYLVSNILYDIDDDH